MFGNKKIGIQSTNVAYIPYTENFVQGKEYYKQLHLFTESAWTRGSSPVTSDTAMQTQQTLKPAQAFITRSRNSMQFVCGGVPEARLLFICNPNLKHKLLLDDKIRRSCGQSVCLDTRNSSTLTTTLGLKTFLACIQATTQQEYIFYTFPYTPQHRRLLLSLKKTFLAHSHTDEEDDVLFPRAHTLYQDGVLTLLRGP